MAEFNFNAYDNWLKQAVDTLRSAKGDIASESYNWACFKAQQLWNATRIKIRNIRKM
ncbi:MAG TPA: HEPN domain-containing protein [Candidatus Lokiarchaeia archaeon]|nr:HEPN domain-containing protein [Candidatus Lokiarchaeia archaeon]